MHRKRHLLPWIVIVLILATLTSHAMTLSPAPLGELLEEADAVVHGVIIERRAEAVPGQPNQLRTRYILWIWDHLKAPKAAPNVPMPASGWLEFVQPGGSTDHITVRVPGVPTFKGGDEVILLLTQTPWGLQPLGYPLGTFFIQASGAIKAAWSGHSPADLLHAFPANFKRRITPQVHQGAAP
jgi:hypothetical protein